MKTSISVGVVLIAGCGSETGSEVFDAGVADHTSADLGTSDMSPPTVLAGVVRLSEVDMMSMNMWMVSAGADFYRPKDFGVPTPVAMIGSCTVYNGGSSGGNMGETLDAGRLEITGGDRDVTLEQTAGGYASNIPDTAESVFSDGDGLQIVAKGGDDFAVFFAEWIAPDEIEVIEPCMYCGLQVDRDFGFYIAWEPTENTDMHLEITAGDVAIACTAADTDGEMVIPAEVTAYLPTSYGGGMLMLTRTSRTTVTGDGASVSLEAATTKCSMGNIE